MGTEGTWLSPTARSDVALQQRLHSLRRKPRSAISSRLILRDQHSYLQPEKTITTNFKPALTHLLLLCIVTRADWEEPQV